MATESAQRSGHMPLSSSQQNIFHVEQVYPGLPTNNVCGTLTVKGQLKIPLLIKSVEILIKSTPELNIRVTETDGVPYQYICEIPAAPPSFYDFSLTGQDGLKNWESSIATAPMPFYDAPLFICAVFRAAPDEGGFLIKTHHLISDAWSHMLLADRIAQIYIQLLSNNEMQMQPLPSFSEHISQEQAYLSSDDHNKDLQYWKDQMVDLPSTLLREQNAAERSLVGQRVSFVLSDRINFLITDFCEKRKVSPFAVFYLAFAMYINRTRGSEKLCLGVPIINRRNYEEKQTIGMFVNTLPLISSVYGTDTLNSLNQRLQNDWYSLLKHQRVPFQDISRISHESGRASALFDIVLSYQNGHMRSYTDTNIRFTGRWHYSGYQTQSLCIHASNREEESCFLLDYDFLTQVFSASEIEQMHEECMRLLQDALLCPDKPLHELSLLSSSMEEKVIYTFNHTQTPQLMYHNLASALSAGSSVFSRRVAIISSGERITYEKLIHDAQEYATRIAAIFPDGRKTIALLFPRDASLFTLLCAVALSGNAYLLLDETMPRARVMDYIKQSEAVLVIGNDGLLKTLDYAAVRCIPVSQILSLASGPVPETTAADLAYLVFTSGSTGNPKAVAVTQRNLLCFSSAMRPLYAGGAVLSLCAVCFDAFVIESIAALLNAKTIVLASEDDRNNPAKLARLIHNFAVGFLALTPSRLSAYLRDNDFRNSLAQVESIVCGGEAFPAQLYSILRGATEARIYNQYGPSEATVGVTCKQICDDTNITVGSPMAGCRLYILDSHHQPLPIGSIGEIYIGGQGVALGYVGDPLLTAERFMPDPFCRKGRMYRSGDLGSWTYNGEIKLHGRADEQFKLNGTRFEPAEITACLTSCPGVKEAAVRLITHDGQKSLVAYYTGDHAPDPEELLSFAATYLPRSVVPAHAIRLGSLPVTVNGKLDVNRLPLPASDSIDEPVLDAIEANLLRIMRNKLHRQDLSVLSDYFASGGDSLSAIDFLQEISSAYTREIPLAALYSHSTVRKLASYIRGNAISQGTYAPFPLAPDLPAYPLSPAQESFFVLHQSNRDSLAYNMPGAFLLSAAIDEDRLQQSFEKLIASDETFRTGFRFTNTGAEQFIAQSVSFTIEHFASADFSGICKEFIRPFDLSKPPLLRAAIGRDDQNRQILLMDCHHILSDGLGSALTIRRIDMFYRGIAPDMPHVRMRDYAYYTTRISKDVLDTQRSFWRRELEHAPDILPLPTDFPYPVIFNPKGNKIRGVLSAEVSKMVNDTCSREKITPFSLFISAFAALLYRICAQQDIVIGIPVSLRTHPDLKETTGALVTTLPLRMRAEEDMSFLHFAKSVHESTIKVLDNRMISFDEITNISDVERDRSRNPLFNAVFSYLPVDASDFCIGDAHLMNQPIDSGITKFDLTLEIAPGKGEYAYTWEYAESLFERGTIEMLTRAYPEALKSVTGANDILIKNVTAVSPYDMIRLIDKPHRTYTPYEHSPVDIMIERKAMLDPSAAAISWGDGKQYTFKEINARAEALASYLLQNGVKPGDCVGLLTQRTGDMSVAMLGIIKAGCAYVPLDHAYPSDRMNYMLTESSASALLLGQEISAPEGCPCRVLTLAFPHGEPFKKPQNRQMSDAFFVLYTSGSTGRPKGVTVIHKSIANLLCDMGPMLDIENCRILCAANVIFDIYTIESMIAWSLGKQIVMCDEQEMLLPWLMAKRMIQGGANVLQLTPSRMQMCLGDSNFRKALEQIKLIILAGEPFGTQLLDSIRSLTAARIINIYGPTETTVFSSYSDLTFAKTVHIGKPVANSRFYALDQSGVPVPPLAQGEIFISGECIARGYIGRDDLTAARFLPDPFFPGDRMYKTGDIARIRFDGSWMFFGRRDSQIKMNGHRIEPDEVTTQILKSGEALEAAIVPVIKDNEVRAIKAFIVPAPQYLEPRLRSYLAPRLPDYMIPATFTVLKELPRTASGKTDMLALSAMKDEQAVIQVKLPDAPDRAAPGKGVTDTLRSIWKTVLTREIDDIDASFFELGGTSLTALTVLNLYYQQGFAFSLADFYKYPTIQAQSNHLSSSESPAEANIPAADVCKAENHEKVQANYSSGSNEQIHNKWTENTNNVLSGIWKTVLESDISDVNASFFSMGGTSLTALAALNLYYQNGYSLSLADFYSHPTIPEQAMMLSSSDKNSLDNSVIEPLGENGKDEMILEKNTGISVVFTSPPEKSSGRYPEFAYPDDDSDCYQNMKIPRRLASNSNTASSNGVLVLTGATGFLGAHVLREALLKGLQVICIIRDEKRLQESLSFYFGSSAASIYQTMFKTVCGDITAPGLGISATEYDKLVNGAAIILHAAADVRHYAPANELMSTNVKGTRNMLSLAKAAAARFLHISTTSVCGDHILNSPSLPVLFTENDLDIGQNWQDNTYTKSKLLAEAEVSQAVQEGLSAHIFRVGRLSARASDGRFQREPSTNAFYRIIKGLSIMEAIPESMRDFQIELTQVDLCSRAILTLVSDPRSCSHLLNPNTLSLRDVLCTLSDTAIIPDDKFRSRLLSVCGNNPSPYLQAVAEMTFGNGQVVSSIKIDAQATQRALSAHGFNWDTPNASVLLRTFKDGGEA